jgi:leucine dehydrogenase
MFGVMERGRLVLVQLSPEELDVLARYEPHVANRWSEPSGHVSVYAVLDHGGEPALGEVCVAGSSEPAAALEQACRLARSASIRLGLLGVARGGAAVVVVPDPALDWEACVELLRERLGASPLRVVAGAGLQDCGERLGPAVLHDPEGLARLRGRVLEACLGPVLPGLAERSSVVLGCEARGRDLAAALGRMGVSVAVWDADLALARAVAESLGARVLDTPWIEAEVDLLVPCGAEPVIDRDVAERLAASVVCGGAPRVLTGPEARTVLEARERQFVPEVLAALAEPLALAVGAGLLEEDEAVGEIEHTAREVLATPRGAHERAVTLAVARSKAATGG